MKVLAVGDMHAKQPWILPYIDEVLKYNPVDRVVFLGDYTDDWSASSQNILDALDYQIDWVYQKESEGFSIVSLVGNHDFGYLSEGIPYLCSGNRRDILEPVKERLKKLNLEICHYQDNILFTHSGILVDYIKKYISPTDIYSSKTVGQLRSMFKNLDKHLMNVGPSRGGYLNEIPGPLWTDIRDITSNGNYDPCTPYNQVVGHTPVSRVTQITNYSCNYIFCDTFSLYHDIYEGDSAIGDGSVTIIDTDGDIRTSVQYIKPEDVYLHSWEYMVQEFINTGIEFNDNVYDY